MQRERDEKHICPANKLQFHGNCPMADSTAQRKLKFVFCIGKMALLPTKGNIVFGLDDCSVHSFISASMLASVWSVTVDQSSALCDLTAWFMTAYVGMSLIVTCT